MRSPSEIAADAVRDERYARAIIERVTDLAPYELRSLVEHDPRAHTDVMAKYILDHYDECYESIPPEHGLELIVAARIAARDGEAHVRFRAEKELANELRRLGRFDEAAIALRSAETLANQCSAGEVFAGVTAFVRATLCCDVGRRDQVYEHAERAIATFEKSGIYDRAYQVRLFLAFMKHREGDYVSALQSFEDAARRVARSGSPIEIGRAAMNLGFCLGSLGDYGSAQKQFTKAALEFRADATAALEAKALRCVARMAIRMRGESAADEMEGAKNLYLELGLAGEVCRSAIAVMEELVAYDAQTNLVRRSQQLEEDAGSLGILPGVRGSISRLRDAAARTAVTQELLQETWEAFGPACSLPAVSGMMTVRN